MGYGKYNSKLLETYGRISSKVHQFLLFVKILVNRNGIQGAKGGFPSNHAWSLLAIWFASTYRQPLVPNLQKERES